MNYYWMSWYQPTEDHRPLTFPPNESILGWWCSGYRGSDDAATLCAMVKGTTPEDAKNSIRKDWPEAGEWRFDEKADSLKLSDRFPIDGWMTERFEKAKLNT